MEAAIAAAIVKLCKGRVVRGDSLPGWRCCWCWCCVTPAARRGTLKSLSPRHHELKKSPLPHLQGTVMALTEMNLDCLQNYYIYSECF